MTGRRGTVTGMRTLTSPGLRSPGRKAATFLEFAFILPIFMFMLMFTLDMGHMMLMSGAMQDATYSAARTGAQAGGASIDIRANTSPCPQSGVCSQGSSYRSLQDTMRQIPGSGKLIELRDMTIVHGGRCTNDGVNDHVEIRTRYDLHLITPGLTAMLDMFSEGKQAGVDNSAWTLKSTAVARCEVIRSAW